MGWLFLSASDVGAGERGETGVGSSSEKWTEDEAVSVGEGGVIPDDQDGVGEWVDPLGRRWYAEGERWVGLVSCASEADRVRGRGGVVTDRVAPSSEAEDEGGGDDRPVRSNDVREPSRSVVMISGGAGMAGSVKGVKGLADR